MDCQFGAHGGELIHSTLELIKKILMGFAPALDKEEHCNDTRTEILLLIMYNSCFSYNTYI